RPQGKQRVGAEVASGFRCTRQEFSNFGGLARRGEPSQPLFSHRRKCKALKGLDNTIEFESPQNSWLHSGSVRRCRPGQAERSAYCNVRVSALRQLRRREMFASGKDQNLYKGLMRLAMAAAPKPLSMLTTAMPDEQLLSIPRSAARPPKLAP